MPAPFLCRLSCRPGVPSSLPQGGISILAYLRTVHTEEFDNFRERIARQAGLHPEVAARISPQDFMPTGALASMSMELQLWASYRAQVLARTVRGMEAYQRALRVLATIEVPCAPGGLPSAALRQWH